MAPAVESIAVDDHDGHTRRLGGGARQRLEAAARRARLVNSPNRAKQPLERLMTQTIGVLLHLGRLLQLGALGTQSRLVLAGHVGAHGLESAAQGALGLGASGGDSRVDLLLALPVELIGKADDVVAQTSDVRVE